LNENGNALIFRAFRALIARFPRQNRAVEPKELWMTADAAQWRNFRGEMGQLSLVFAPIPTVF
jgi:hypothetical protein